MARQLDGHSTRYRLVPAFQLAQSADRPTPSETDPLAGERDLLSLVELPDTCFDLLMELLGLEVDLAREAEKGYSGDHSRPPSA
jgi:hypothetical protein